MANSYFVWPCKWSSLLTKGFRQHSGSELPLNFQTLRKFQDEDARSCSRSVFLCSKPRTPEKGPKYAGHPWRQSTGSLHQPKILVLFGESSKLGFPHACRDPTASLRTQPSQRAWQTYPASVSYMLALKYLHRVSGRANNLKAVPSLSARHWVNNISIIFSTDTFENHLQMDSFVFYPCN